MMKNRGERKWWNDEMMKTEVMKNEMKWWKPRWPKRWMVSMKNKVKPGNLLRQLPHNNTSGLLYCAVCSPPYSCVTRCHLFFLCRYCFLFRFFPFPLQKYCWTNLLKTNFKSSFFEFFSLYRYSTCMYRSHYQKSIKPNFLQFRIFVVEIWNSLKRERHKVKQQTLRLYNWSSWRNRQDHTRKPFWRQWGAVVWKKNSAGNGEFMRLGVGKWSMMSWYFCFDFCDWKFPLCQFYRYRYIRLPGLPPHSPPGTGSAVNLRRLSICV